MKTPLRAKMKAGRLMRFSNNLIWQKALHTDLGRKGWA